MAVKGKHFKEYKTACSAEKMLETYFSFDEETVVSNPPEMQGIRPDSRR